MSVEKMSKDSVRGKSSEELDELSRELAAIKEAFLTDWNLMAGILQAEIAEAQKREYIERNSDPVHAAKRQGPVPDFAKPARK